MTTDPARKAVHDLAAGGGLLIDAADAADVSLCGGKATGLALLHRSGFAVPNAVCLTTQLYRRCLEISGLGTLLARDIERAVVADPERRRYVLATIRDRVEAVELQEELIAELRDPIARVGHPGGRLAVRSSAPYEDHSEASHAGIHTSEIVAAEDLKAVVAAVKTCWASLWTEAAWSYRERLGLSHDGAAMAVVVQRFVLADCSGVAFSADPLTRDRATVVIEAGRADGDSVVSGRLTPDLYHVTMALPEAPALLRWRPGSSGARPQPPLAEPRVLELAHLVKSVERVLGVPSDVEWVFDGLRFWAVQARPISAFDAPVRSLKPAPTLWTRANLKEVFPDLPSPLALSYLGVTLNVMFSSYNAAQGYALPPDAELVSVFRGRPYLNLSLMQGLAVERGGDPAVVSRLFGGQQGPARLTPRPAATASSTANRLRLVREMLATFFRTPYRGRRLFGKIRRYADRLRSIRLDGLDDRALIAHLGHFGARLLDERALRRLHEVISAQSRAYMALDQLLAAWIGGEADSLVKRLMTGLGTLPNVRMTYSLMTLGGLAAASDHTRAFFVRELDEHALRGWKTTLGGTEFAAAFQTFLDEFGHRGPYESDVMSARFAEDPSPVLRVIQLYVKADAIEDPARHAAERRRIRQAAMDVVRVALRQGQGRVSFALRWAAFSIMRGALQRLLALRDECRHVMTMMVAHLRQISLEIGRRATAHGLLEQPDDVFFLRWQELPRILTERQYDWRGTVRGRRIEREDNAQLEAPDLLGGDERLDATSDSASDDVLAGLGVSPGTVVGTVTVLGGVTDVRPVSGEIIVVPAIEPTLTPIFPLIQGMVAEMGGLLSHAAILAREYGLPAVVSVPGATRRLRDGDLIELDGASGRIRILERARPAADAGQRLPGQATEPYAPMRDEVGGDHGPDDGTRQDIGDVVTLEVDTAQGYRGREPVEHAAEPRIVRGVDGSNGEHRGRVAGRERIDALGERGAEKRCARHPGVRPRPADEVLEAELEQAGGGKGQPTEGGRVLKPRPAEGTAQQAEDQAGQQQRHPAPNGVDRADQHVESDASPVDGPASDAVVEGQRGDRD